MFTSGRGSTQVNRLWKKSVSIFGRGGGGERERERERERQTDRQTDRQADRQTEKEREGECATDRQTDIMLTKHSHMFRY